MYSVVPWVAPADRSNAMKFPCGPKVGTALKTSTKICLANRMSCGDGRTAKSRGLFQSKRSGRSALTCSISSASSVEFWHVPWALAPSKMDRVTPQKKHFKGVIYDSELSWKRGLSQSSSDFKIRVASHPGPRPWNQTLHKEPLRSRWRWSLMLPSGVGHCQIRQLPYWKLMKAIFQLHWHNIQQSSIYISDWHLRLKIWVTRMWLGWVGKATCTHCCCLFSSWSLILSLDLWSQHASCTCLFFSRSMYSEVTYKDTTHPLCAPQTTILGISNSWVH